MKKRDVLLRLGGILLVAVVLYVASYGPVVAYVYTHPVAEDERGAAQQRALDGFYAPVIWWETSSQTARDVSFAYYYWWFLRFNPGGEDPFFDREPARE